MVFKALFLMFPQVLCCAEALAGSEATCPCGIRWAVTEELFPTAPGVSAGFVLPRWQSLVCTAWEKCQCPRNFQPFHHLETQDENTTVTLFKLKLFSILALWDQNLKCLFEETFLK